MKNALDIFFGELTRISGELGFSSNSLGNNSHLLQENILKNSYKAEYTYLSRLVISDIIGETDNGWFYKFALDPKYKIKTVDLIDETNEIISKLSCFALIQSFESLKRFMRLCIIIYFEKKPTVGRLLLSINKTKKNINWEKEFNAFGNQKKDVEFETLAKISTKFDFGINNNNYKINLKDYLSVFKTIRNRIVHNNFTFSQDDFNSFGSNKAQIGILNYFFPYIKIGRIFKIQLNPEWAKKNIDVTAEIGLLIYNGVSELITDKK